MKMIFPVCSEEMEYECDYKQGMDVFTCPKCGEKVFIDLDEF